VSINEEDDQPKRKSLFKRLANRLFKGDVKVGLIALGLLISSTGNSVWFKKMSNKMYNYSYFLSQFSSFIYLPIFFGVVAYEIKFTNFITPEMREFPKRKYLFMGLFDALSSILMLFGSVHTSGTFQSLLLNAVIPFTMVLSILVLKTKYLRTQYAGAATIMAGVAVVLIPVMVNKGSTGNVVLFNIIFLLSTIPQAFSSIYKEIAFGDADLDVNLLQAWVAFFQFFLGILLAPFNSLPFLQDQYIPIDRLPYTISNGARCMVGINSVVNHTIIDNSTGMAYGSCWLDEDMKWGAPADSHCDSCDGAWIPIFVYTIFNLGYNLFIVLTIKYGSAALLWIILTLRLPLVQIAFAIPAITAPNPADPFRWSSVVGLFVILAGLILYRWSSVASAAVPDGEDDEAPNDLLPVLDEPIIPSESFDQRLHGQLEF